MYVWQMNDGRWHISLINSKMFSRILTIPEATRLYNRGYDLKCDARAAERRIRELLDDWRTRPLPSS